jgi:tetratricopeptide (TPR) repeat protein
MEGDLEPARNAFQTAVRLNRTQVQPSPWPPQNLGYLLLRIGEMNQAEQALRESLRYDPKLGRTHYYLARTLENEGRQAEAIDEYRSAITMDAQGADACYSLAILFRRLHRNAESNAMFEEFRKRKRSAG